MRRGPSAAFLDGACAGDASLRAEVEEMLAAEEEAGSFINTSAMKVAASAVADEQEIGRASCRERV